MTSLENQITLAFNTVNDTRFHVFVVPEFYFMNGNRGEDSIRWYTRDERDQVIAGLKQHSKRYPRFLLAGGTICWAETTGGMVRRVQWNIYNEAPVCYNGKLLKSHRKRSAGGEALASDTLRLYAARKGSIDRRVTKRIDDAEDGTAQYQTADELGSLEHLANLTGTHKGVVLRNGSHSAPGIRAAFEHYDPRIHYKPGHGDGSFNIPGTNFNGGIEICQEHNGSNGRGELQATSALGETNFHILTSNSVTYREGHENIANPGYFIHCDTQTDPLVIERGNGGKVRIPEDQWQNVHDKLHVLNLPMPPGL